MSEDDVQRKWHEMAPLIERMMERVGTEDEFPVAVHSSLHGDDRAAAPYQVSHVLRMCLTAAVDHLHAVKVLVVDAGTLHIAAPSSLSRGALENLATAYWILGPSQRNERIERTLRWHAKNFKDQQNAISELNHPGHETLESRRHRLYTVGETRGIAETTIRNGYSSTEAVKYAESTDPDLPLGVVLPWRLCSGFAHGRPWAYLGFSVREEFGREADIVNVKLTSDLDRALYPALSAFQLLQRFLRLYMDRAASRLD